MKPDRLYLLKPHFMDTEKGPHFRPGCAQLVGLLEFYPAFKQQLKVRWLDFPRSGLIDLLNEANQGCPMLVLSNVPNDLPATLAIQQTKGRWFIEGADEIADCLAHVHGTGIPH